VLIIVMVIARSHPPYGISLVPLTYYNMEAAALLMVQS